MVDTMWQIVLDNEACICGIGLAGLGLIVLTTHPAVTNKQRKLYRSIGLLLTAIGSLSLVRIFFSGGN